LFANQYAATVLASAKVVTDLVHSCRVGNGCSDKGNADFIGLTQRVGLIRSLHLIASDLVLPTQLADVLAHVFNAYRRHARFPFALSPSSTGANGFGMGNRNSWPPNIYLKHRQSKTGAAAPTITNGEAAVLMSALYGIGGIVHAG
jgi:hypothetical protein